MEISIQNYVVVFIDVLGQRAQMEGLLFMPPQSDEEGRREFRERILRSLRPVMFIQHNFQFQANSSNEWYRTMIHGIEPHLVETVQKFRKANIMTQRFSDGLVLFCPLTEEGHFPLSSVSRIFLSCASMMLCGLNEGFPFRAGIAIGAGCSIEEGDIYGPVLAEAYRLESEVAVYPRVVLSDCIADWLSSFDEKSYSSDEEMRVTLALRDLCLGSIMKDKDGVLAIDYLSPRTLELLGGPQNVSEPIRGMKNFVDSMIALHKDEPRILRKYAWVRDYIGSRIQD